MFLLSKMLINSQPSGIMTDKKSFKVWTDHLRRKISDGHAWISFNNSNTNVEIHAYNDLYGT